MPIGITYGDQGSDVNLISELLRKAIGFPVITLGSKGQSGLTMNTVDRNSSLLVAYTNFMMGVHGIWRRVYAFIRPETETNHGELALLLGLPQLEDINAKIYIRYSLIEIGDPAIREKPVTVQGLLFIYSSEYRLILHPKDPSTRKGSGKIPVYLLKMDSQTPIEADTSESVSESGSSDADNESEYTTEDKSSESESEN